jgi:lysophospholipase L1-like esterase
MQMTLPSRPRRARGQRGATTTEYALVLVGVAAAATLALALLTPSIVGLFDRIGCLAGIGCDVDRPTEKAVDPWDDPDPLVRATWGGVAVLGDSYSSGEGAGDYGVAATTLGCHASASGYGVGLTKHLGLDRSRLTIRACTGARLSAIAGGYDDHGQGPQLDGIDQSTSLITMSIGGNDVDWSHVLVDCITKAYLPGSIDCHEGTGLARDVEARIDSVGPRLAEVLEQVRARAPFARVAVMGYPRFFPDEPERIFEIEHVPAFGTGSQRWANEQTDRLNQVIARTAVEAGVEYVDVGRAFAGHELTTDEPWFNGVDVDLDPLRWDGLRPKVTVDASAFHPTASGQRALAGLVEAQVRQPARVHR